MADHDGTRGRAETWPQETRAGGRAAGDAVARLVGPFAHQLAQWAAREVGAGRLMPWLPVAFAIGVALYFGAEREPSWWAPALLTFGLTMTAVLVRRRAVAFVAVVALAAIASGFLLATLRTAARDHPVLRQAAYGIAIAGFVEAREERERSDRIVVAVRSMSGGRLERPLDRVRVSVRKGTAPPIGSYVSMTARLSPPLQPLRPGGYDFARDLYFQGIGASGFVTGAIKLVPAPMPPDFGLRAKTMIGGWRDGIDARIRAALPGDAGVIASALITGKRDAISTPVNDAMYVSSLAHVLSISGYHMAVVAGVVFFTLRGLFALVPGLALRRPVKKWAAAGALGAAAFYLVLSGAEVATQRSFAMTAIVLIGIMLDRPALTLRTLAVAALAVMLLQPESVVHPSFQMSFAATLALVAVYERGLPMPKAGTDSSLTARAALWGGREIAALIVASLVAGAATTPYAAFHFHRMAPYGVLANLAAMPVVSAWTMPCGLLALVAMPFGYDAPLWRAMGWGIDWMATVALWVAALPGAVGRVPAFGIGALIAATAGLTIICLLRTPLRWSGLALLAVAAGLAVRAPAADVLVSADRAAVAVRGGDGRLQILRGSDSFAAREWLAADGDARMVTDPAIQQGFACDEVGCVARLADGRLVAVARSPEAFADDCGRAILVVTARTAPPGCRAFVIDRTGRDSGAVALRRHGEGWRVTAARPRGEDRPWAPAAARGSDQTGRAPTAGRTVPLEATPRSEDLEVDD